METNTPTLTNYKKLSRHIFQHLLINALPDYDQHQIQQYLINTDIVQVFQELAQFLCHYFQLKVEKDYWNYIANLNIPIIT